MINHNLFSKTPLHQRRRSHKTKGHIIPMYTIRNIHRPPITRTIHIHPHITNKYITNTHRQHTTTKTHPTTRRITPNTPNNTITLIIQHRRRQHRIQPHTNTPIHRRLTRHHRRINIQLHTTNNHTINTTNHILINSTQPPTITINNRHTHLINHTNKPLIIITRMPAHKQRLRWRHRPSTRTKTKRLTIHP